jgi:mannose-6-phosphate isomerase class I
MQIHVKGQFSELMFSSDNVIFFDEEDRKPKKKIVVLSATQEAVYHSVSRYFKYITLLGCVSIDGDALLLSPILAHPIKE